MYVDDRSCALSPYLEESAYVGLRLRIVAWSSTRVREALLYVDDQKRSATIERDHSVS